jgi:hypothetical protein
MADLTVLSVEFKKDSLKKMISRIRVGRGQTADSPKKLKPSEV